MKEKTALFISDEENVVHSLQSQLTSLGFQLQQASKDNALKKMEALYFPLVIVDQPILKQAPTLLEQLKELYPHTIRILLTSQPDQLNVQEIVNKGEVFKILSLPYEEVLLQQTLTLALAAAKSLKENERKNYIFDNALEGIVVTNLENIIQSTNLSFLLLTGLSEKEVIQTNIWELFDGFPIEEKREITEELAGNQVWQGETVLTLKNGSKISGLLSISEVLKSSEDECFRSFSFISIPELKQKENLLENIQKRDQETKLLSRSGIEEQLAKLIFEDQDKTFPIYITTFYFKEFTALVNSMGVQFGINAALEIGALLKESIGINDHLGRTNQDSFVLLTRHKKTQDDFLTFIQEICDLFKNPLTIQHQSYNFTPIVGISVFPEETTDAEKLIDQSHLAAQQALENGNAYLFYSQNIDRQTKLNVYLSTEVNNLIHRQGYDIYFQPLFSSPTMKLFGLEALINVQMPTKRIISNQFFLNKAEEIYLIHIIEQRLLRESSQYWKQWNTLNSQSLQLSLTVSSQHLLNENLLNYLENLLPKLDIPPSSITVEIKEDKYFKDILLFQKSLINLRQLGIKIALNEISGYGSAFHYLISLPVDAVNIDGALLANPRYPAQYIEFLQASIHYCKAIGLTVTIKEINTAEQLEIAKGLKADHLQGNFLCPPEPAWEIKKHFLEPPVQKNQHTN